MSTHPSAPRVASRHLLLEIVSAFLKALRSPNPRRAFDAVIPTMVELASGSLDFLVWRINAALHAPGTAGRVSARLLGAVRSGGPVGRAVEKVVAGDPLNESDVDKLMGVVEGTVIDVLSDIGDVRAAAEALKLPVDDAVRLVVGPKFDSARETVKSIVWH